MSKETTEKPKHSIDIIVYKLELQSRAIEELKDALKGNITTRTLYGAFGVFIALWGSFSWIIYGYYEKDRQLLKVEIRKEVLEELTVSSSYLSTGGR